MDKFEEVEGIGKTQVKAVNPTLRFPTLIDNSQSNLK